MDEKEIAAKLVEILDEIEAKLSGPKTALLVEHLAELIPAAGGITTVHVEGVRGAVERVEAYGLEFELDGHGRAVSVTFPDGATWTE